MSLFSAKNIYGGIVHPDIVVINGEVSDSFFYGTIEMTYHNTRKELDEYTIIIGQSTSNNIYLHDFKIMLDGNPFYLRMKEKSEAEKDFEENKEKFKQTVFFYEKESKSTLIIPYILPDQIVTILAEFETSITFTTNSTFELLFPLTYPSQNNDSIIQCENFHFSCKFDSLPIKINSIQSNPEGKIDLQTNIYSIDHLDSSSTQITITFDLNPSNFSDKIETINNSNNSVLFEKGTSSFYEKYGSVTFIPIKEKKIDENHSGEEFIFIVDCSLSMDGDEIELASQCLILFIQSLPLNCYFNIIRFGSSFVKLFEKPVLYTNENARKALQLAFSLKADLGGTRLSKPLISTFSNSLSVKNKLRRIFILTDGYTFNPKQVIKIVKQNSDNTICNAIGIGLDVDKELVEGIGNFGNGFSDFVLSGDDMKLKVMNQLSKNLNGLCKIDVSIENIEDLRIFPPLSHSRFSFNEPATFYFESSNILKDNYKIHINIKGNSKPMIIHMNSLKNQRTQKCLEYMFHYKYLKYLRNLDQTKEIKREIISISFKYNILTPYTALFGVKEYSSPKEKERTIQQIKELMPEHMFTCDKNIPPNAIVFKDLTGGKVYGLFDPAFKVIHLKSDIERKTGIPIEQQKIYYQDNLLDDDERPYDMGVRYGDILQVIYILSGGGGGGPCNFKPKRSYCKPNVDDLVSIIAEQQVEGCWICIPDFIAKSSNAEMKEIIQKIQKWAKNNNFSDFETQIIATVTSLVYIVKYKKELHKIWELVYQKALRWLNSINKTIDWKVIVKSF